MAQGHSNARIGTLLGLSQRTVESHVRNLFVHLGLEDIARQQPPGAGRADLHQGLTAPCVCTRSRFG